MLLTGLGMAVEAFLARADLALRAVLAVVKAVLDSIVGGY